MKMGILWQVAVLMGLFPFLESKTLSLGETTTLNRLMGEVARCARVPAMSMTLVRDGQIVYTNGFGTINKQRQKPATSRSVFCLGDITQTFTATLLAKMLDEHQNYTWDTPVQEILGAQVNFGDRYRNEYLSLRDILSMRTGLSNMDAVVMTKAMDRVRLIRNLRFTPKVASFRQKYVHNNLLFVLVEEVARTLGGQTWYKLVRDKILHPLGMSETYFINTDAREQDNLAQPVMSYNGAPFGIPLDAMKGQEIIAAGSSICSSAEDIGKWLLLNLNNGVTQDGGQLLSSDLMEDLFEAQTIRSGEGDAMVEGFSQPDIQVSYTRDANTLGWISGQYRGFKVLSQDGSIPGYESLMSFIPARNVGVFVAFTGDSGPKAYSAKTLVNIFALDILIQGQPWFKSNDFCNYLDKMYRVASSEDGGMARGINQAAESKRPLEEYQGSYRNLAFGDVRVWVNESLYLKYGDMGDYILRPTNKENVFIMEAVPGALWYSTHMDMLRKRPYIAYFDTTPYSDDRIEEVKIPHFDKVTDPVFSKRVRLPPMYDEVRDCNGATSLMSYWALTLTILLTFVR